MECSLIHRANEIALVDEFIHDLCTYKGCLFNCYDACNKYQLHEQTNNIILYYNDHHKN